MRMRSIALVGVALVLASGCGGQLGAGSVDAARAACIEAARKKGDQPIETENVKVLGEGRYEMSVRNKATLGSSVTTCTYDKNIGAAIIHEYDLRPASSAEQFRAGGQGGGVRPVRIVRSRGPSFREGRERREE